jgi:CRP-like cAMP-binding protein
MTNIINPSDRFTQSDFFDGIEKKEQSEILCSGHRHLFQLGDTLFREGEPAIQCYLVLKGCLKLSKLHEDGKEVIVRYINSGEMTALISVFQGKNYPATAQIVDSAEVVGWKREIMMKLITTHSQLFINILRSVVDRLDDIQNRYLELCAERVEQRIARTILRIMKKSGRKTDEGVLIDIRLSRQDLADYTGTTLYTVSRTLSSWEKKGWIASTRERIVVANPHALVTFAQII